jgi:TPR repeat protein
MAFNESLLFRGRGTVRAANSGDADSQAELAHLHCTSATRLDILQGALADDNVVSARWAVALRFAEMAAAQGVASAQAWSCLIYATGGRCVPQNWATAVKWLRKAAEGGELAAQWHIGLCYYYGRGGLVRDVARSKVWFRKSAAQENPMAVDYFCERIVKIHIKEGFSFRFIFWGKKLRLERRRCEESLFLTPCLHTRIPAARARHFHVDNVRASFSNTSSERASDHSREAPSTSSC